MQMMIGKVKKEQNKMGKKDKTVHIWPVLMTFSCFQCNPTKNNIFLL